MNGIHMLCGTPRSGSTLLGNILEQHPDLYVSGTSSLASCVQAVSLTISNSEEVKSEMAAMPESYERYRASLRGLVEGRYEDRTETVIDKGRLWGSMRLLVDETFPDAQFICCVRDPRDVVASIEVRHRGTGVFMAEGPDQTLAPRAEALMVRDGLVGGPMFHVEDLIRRQLTSDVVFVKYETFTANPQTTMDQITDACALEPFSWKFKDVKNRDRDEDAIWRDKFPHQGDGDVKRSPASWRDVMDEKLGADILGVFPLFAETFGYS